jgi:hypothetical protein
MCSRIRLKAEFKPSASLTFAIPGFSVPAMKTIEQSVAEIDAGRAAYFTRSPDRPRARLIAQSKKPLEIKKAESRLRTAAWRQENDKLKKPEGAAAAMQFLVSTVSLARGAGLEGLDAFRPSEAAFQHALDELVARGFDREAAKSVFRRLTRRLK